ncbi:MAG: hypothetical protein JO030_00085 [Candidatus Eremiobacteraeota bacterium]|nr:hypothetical protein [Candidatus Eremiobacteraeota bacterium]
MQSWVAPEAKGEDLLYVSDANNGIFIFTYPAGKLVGQLTSGFTSPDGMCSDRHGNVFITDTQTYRVLEFAHGGATPIGALYGPPSMDFRPSDCSVDPLTGNLATTNIESAQVLVFPKAQGSGKTYTVPRGALFYCAYDGKGDLFADEVFSRKGTVYIAELPVGRRSLSSSGSPEQSRWLGR